MIFTGIMTSALSQTERRGGADREARMAQFMEQMRQRLTAAGATDADVQAIMAYRGQQREIQAPLQEAMRALRAAAGEGATDAQAKDAVAKYEAAMKTVADKLAKAEQDLKAKLDLANKPRLHAMLLAMGILDNGQRGRGMMMFGGGRGGGGRPGGGGARGGGGGAAR
jgi:hypothetical protein